jgi:DnaD/phage-associated family protein
LEVLEIYQNQSEEIRNLFKYAERILGKLLTYNDLNVIFGFYDWLRLPIDEIEYLFDYCAKTDHRDLRYMEKVAVSWAEKGVTDLEKAQNYTQNFNKNYRELVRAFGGNGFPSATQKKNFDKWLDTYKMPLEVILAACDISTVNTGAAKLTYVSKIMDSWNEQGIHTLEAAQREKDEFSKDKPQKKSASAKQPERKNRFANFTQRTIDFAEIERKEKEMQLRHIMKG